MVGLGAADADLGEGAGRAGQADGDAGDLAQHVGHVGVALVLDGLAGDDGDGLAEFFGGEGGGVPVTTMVSSVGPVWARAGR